MFLLNSGVTTQDVHRVIFLDHVVVEAVKTKSKFLKAGRVLVAAEQISNVEERYYPRVPSLVDVLCTLAANWALCECGVEIGKVGVDGWSKEGLRLGDEIDSLIAKIQQIGSPSRKATQQKKLEKLQAQSDTINKEWAEAHHESDVYRELFWDAREFCISELGIGDNELFNAALVGFNPDRLQLGQGPSKHRITELAMLLSNLKLDNWKTQRWANPAKPTMRAARRVTPEKLNSFIVQNLKQVTDPNQPAAEKWLSPRSVTELMKETGCGRTTINVEVKNGNIPGGASRENNKSRGNVILKQTGLDYLKKKGGNDKKDRR